MAKKKTNKKHRFIHKEAPEEQITVNQGKEQEEKIQGDRFITNDIFTVLKISVTILLAVIALYLIWTKTGLLNPLLSKFGI